MRKIILVVCLALMLPCFSQAQVVIRFTQNGAGNRDGSSWANAKPGSELAQTMRFYFSYVQIWVAAGTYKPHNTVRDSSFHINSYLKVYGGFNGTETQLSQRNWAANPTILSGNIGSQTDSTDNSYHVVQFNNADTSTLLDGFIIEGGYADSVTNWNNVGGGIKNFAVGTIVSYSNPLVNNCMIRNNFAETGGGGIANFAIGASAGIRVTNCLIERNRSGMGSMSGGGMLSIAYIIKGNINPVVDRCTFRNNSAGVGAGAIMQFGDADNSGNISIKNCLFDSNRGLSVGAIYVTTNPDPYNQNVHTSVMNTVIDSCHFIRNTATNAGSSIIAVQANRGLLTKLQISNTTIDSNASSSAPIYVSGIYSASRNLIDKCIIHHHSGDDAGAVVISSGGSHVDSTIINNSLFYNSGKGLFVSIAARDGGDAYTFVNNTTMYQDSVHMYPLGSGLISNLSNNSSGNIDGASYAYTYINNSIIWHYNQVTFPLVKSLSTYRFGSSTNASIYTKSSILNLVNGNWPVGAPPFGQADYGVNDGNNAGLYPRFRDTAHFDFRPGCGSPALNTGNNALVPSGMLKDLAGKDRILNTTVDKGCYEADSLPTPLSSPTVAQSGRTITCTAGYNMLPDSLVWSFGDGQLSRLSNPTHTYINAGTYNVCLRIYTACGSNEKCTSVTISPNSIISYNSGGEPISLFPNPTTGMISINGIKERSVAHLSTLTGKRVNSVEFSGAVNQLDLTNLPAGIYILDIKTVSEKRYVVRVVKQ